MFIVSTGSMQKLDKLSSKIGVWHCTICTHENDQNVESCDLCGVLRDFYSKFVSDDDKSGIL